MSIESVDPWTNRCARCKVEWPDLSFCGRLHELDQSYPIDGNLKGYDTMCRCSGPATYTAEDIADGETLFLADIRIDCEGHDYSFRKFVGPPDFERLDGPVNLYDRHTFNSIYRMLQAARDLRNVIEFPNGARMTVARFGTDQSPPVPPSAKHPAGLPARQTIWWSGLSLGPWTCFAFGYISFSVAHAPQDIGTPPALFFKVWLEDHPREVSHEAYLTEGGDQLRILRRGEDGSIAADDDAPEVVV